MGVLGWPNQPRNGSGLVFGATDSAFVGENIEPKGAVYVPHSFSRSTVSTVCCVGCFRYRFIASTRIAPAKPTQLLVLPAASILTETPYSISIPPFIFPLENSLFFRKIDFLNPLFISRIDFFSHFLSSIFHRRG